MAQETDDQRNRDAIPPGLTDVSAGYVHEAPLLGSLLLSETRIAMPELADALARQASSGTTLGAELMAAGSVRGFDLHTLLARQRGVPFVDLTLFPPEPDLMTAHDLSFYLSHQILPWRRVHGEVHYAAADVGAATDLIAERTGSPFRVFQTAPRDIVRAALSVYGDALTGQACTHLKDTQPDASSAQLLPPAAKTGVLLFLAILTGIGLTFPQTMLIGFILLAAAVFSSLAVLRLASAMVAPRAAPIPFSRRNDHELPVYSVLVPLLREAEVLPILTHALQQLDYPAAKLDIKLIFEEGDEATYQAACALRLPDNFEFILVPASHPTTKPKACNFALPFVRGEFVVVYDAEDLPGPGQLREALHKFDAVGARLACVQAPLAYYNSHENWLTRQFAIEYAAIFDLLLPMLAHFRLPFPLGGTSTHFRTQVLRQVGAWDPYNVTEDADLGIRLHEAGYTSDVIYTATLEEANCRLGNWTRQRSRWLKGWMQTYIVRMRRPFLFFRNVGWPGFFTFQIVIGAFVLSALMHPLLYLSLGAGLLWGLENHWTANGLAFAAINGIALVLGFTATIIAGLAGAARRGLSGLFLSALTMPIYWLLISAGAYRAFYQLLSRPHYWEKTIHGVSRLVPGQLARARRSDRR